MKFIKKMKKVIHFVSGMNTIKSNYYKIKNTNDYQNPKLYVNIKNALIKVHELLNDEEFSNTKSEVIQKIQKDLHLLEYEMEYIQKFLQKDWHACLNLGMEIEKSNASYRLELCYPIILDTLNQLKNETTEKDYNELYKWIEVDYESKAHQYMVLKTFETKNAVSNNEKVIKVEYNGIYMALAYMAYLNGDEEKMMNYIENQKEIFPLEKILKHENIEQQPWYYSNIDKNYIDFLTKSLLKPLELESKEAKKIRM
jgi:hypothetical protein